MFIISSILTVADGDIYVGRAFVDLRELIRYCS